MLIFELVDGFGSSRSHIVWISSPWRGLEDCPSVGPTSCRPPLLDNYYVSRGWGAPLHITRFDVPWAGAGILPVTTSWGEAHKLNVLLLQHRLLTDWIQLLGFLSVWSLHDSEFKNNLRGLSLLIYTTSELFWRSKNKQQKNYFPLNQKLDLSLSYRVIRD